MNTKTLEEKLNDALDDFANEVKFNRETSDKVVTPDDLEELGRQTFYVLGKFRDIIVEHLKEK